jgi:hypothetical protein
LKEAQILRRLRNSIHAHVRVELCVRCDGVESHLALNSSGTEMHKIDITLSRGAVLQLAFGYRPIDALLVEEYAGAQRVGANPQLPGEESLTLLATLFPHRHPFMWQPDRY